MLSCCVSCFVLQNIKACKESVLEAAQLYVDEHDDEKVQQTANTWHVVYHAGMCVPAVGLCAHSAACTHGCRWQLLSWGLLDQAAPQPQTAVCGT
jgi:hypothetical protein